MTGLALILASLLAPAPGPARVKYITLTLSVPVGTNPRDIVRMVDDMPYEGVYVVDAADLPGKPKHAVRPDFLPKIPRECAE